MFYQVNETNLADQHQSTSEATVLHYNRPMGTARDALSGSDPFMQRGAMHVEYINRHTAFWRTDTGLNMNNSVLEGERISLIGC